MCALNFLHFSGKSRECENGPKCGDSSLLTVYMLCFYGPRVGENQQFASGPRDSSRKNLLISMKSRGIPNTSDEDGLIGAHKTPDKAKSGFIQAPAFITKEIRRVGEQTSPQVARAVGHPGMGRGRRIGQWQQLNPSFSFQRRLTASVEERRDSGAQVQRREPAQGGQQG